MQQHKIATWVFVALVVPVCIVDASLECMDPMWVMGMPVAKLQGDAAPGVLATGALGLGDGLPDVVLFAAANATLVAGTGSGGGAFSGFHALADTTGVHQLAVVDLMDTDADHDLVFANASAGGGGLFWMHNTGGGVFDEPVRLATGDVARMATGLVNGDAALDLVFCTSSGTLGWVENLGGGAFAGVSLIATNVSGCVDVAIRDMDGSGSADVLALTASHWAWYANDGNGGFSVDAPFARVPLPSAATMAVDDFSGTGVPEVVACTERGTVERFVRVGGPSSTTWAMDVLIAPGMHCEMLQTADIDGSGSTDLIWADDMGLVYWLSNHGAGAWNPRRQPLWMAMSMKMGGFALADVDDDGRVDMLATDMADSKLETMLNPSDAAGMFKASNVKHIPGVFFDTADVQLADLSADGVTDVLLSDATDGSVVYFRGVGDGAYASAVTIADNQMAPRAIATGDYDNDGFVDLAFCSSMGLWLVRTDAIGVFSEPDMVGKVYMNDLCESVVFADVNADGALDLLAVFQTPDTSRHLNVFLNTGPDPSARDMHVPYPPMANQDQVVSSAHLSVGHASSDAFPDLLVGARLLLNTGTGLFPAEASGVEIAALAEVGAGVWGTLDNGASPGVCLIAGSYVRCYRNTNGDGLTWTAAWTSPVLGGPQSVVLADVNLDGWLDVVVGTTSPASVRYFPNLGSGNGAMAGTAMVVASSADDIGPSSLKVADLDGDGDLDVLTPDAAHKQLQWYPAFSTWRVWPRESTEITYNPAVYGWSLGGIMRVVAAQASLCTADTIRLPAGTYEGCFERALHVIVKSVTIAAVTPGSVTWECAGTGGLFHVTDGASLTLSGIRIRGARSVIWDRHGGSPLRVSGQGTTLTLDRVSIHNATALASSNGVTQLGAGAGGAVAAIDGATIVLTHTNITACFASQRGGAIALANGASLQATDARFESNTAGHGGALHVIGTCTVSIADSSLTNNVASPGHGGAIATGTDQDANSISLNGVLMQGNAADTAGGALFVVASDAATVDVVDTTFAANHARYAGALAIVGPPFPFTSADVSQIKRSTQTVTVAIAVPATPGTLALTGASFVDNQARYGGILALCNVRVNVTSVGAVSGNHALVAAGAVFVCASEDTTVITGGVVPWLDADTATHAALLAGDASAARYGDAVASPAVSLGWADTGTPEPTTVASGVALGPAVTVTLTDWFGQVVTDDQVSLRLALVGVADSTDAPLALIGGASQALALAHEISFADVAVARNTETATDSPAAAVSIAVTDSVSPLEVFTAPITFTECPPGFGRQTSASDRLLVCGRCSAGSFSGATSDAPCDNCPANAVGMPVNGTSEAAFVCSCAAGFYSPQGAYDTECTACPAGGECPGGLAAPYAQPGFWEESPAKFVECKRPGACRGGQSAQNCAPGHVPTSYMCNECEDGWYTDAAGKCAECPDHSLVLLVLMVVLVVVVAFSITIIVIFSAAKHLSTQVDHGRTLEFLRRKQLPHSISVCIIFFQVLGLLGTNLTWPKGVERTFLALGSTNVDFSTFAGPCTIDSFAALYIIQMCLPMLFLGAVLVLLVVLQLVRRFTDAIEHLFRGLTVRGVIERVLLMVTPLAFIPLSKHALVLFDCVQLPNGKYHLDADLQMECFSSEWWGLFPFAVLGCVLYVATPLAVFAMILWRNRNNLLEHSCVIRFGSLYGLYRLPYFYFEVVVLLKRLGMVIIFLFFSRYPVWLIGFQIFLFGAFALIQAKYAPFHHPLYNALELRLDISVVVILLLGAAFWADRFPSSASRTLFVVITVLVVAASILMIAHAALLEILMMRRREKRIKNGQGLEPVRMRQFWRTVDAMAPDLEDRDVAFVIQRMKETGADRKATVIAEPEIPLQSLHESSVTLV